MFFDALAAKTEINHSPVNCLYTLKSLTFQHFSAIFVA